MREKILIIEDDKDICNILKCAFEREGYEIEITPEGLKAEEFIKWYKPALILLDIMLGDTDGFNVCKIITKYKIPIIMITARGDITDKILGLELGADDYITKPFDIREVVTRVRVALRRKINENNIEINSLEKNIIKIGQAQINIDMRKVYINEDEIILKAKEYDLLLFLCENKNKVYSREQLVENLWGYDFLGDSRTIDVHITRIRKKLKGAISLETVFSVGYVVKD